MTKSEQYAARRKFYGGAKSKSEEYEARRKGKASLDSVSKDYGSARDAVFAIQNGWQAQEQMDSYKELIGKYVSNLDTARNYVSAVYGNAYRDKLNAGYNFYSSVYDNIDSLKEVYADFDSADAWNSYLEDRKRKEQQDKEYLAFDTTAGATEVDSMKAKLAEAKAEYDRLVVTTSTQSSAEEQAAHNARRAELNALIKELETSVQGKELYLENAKRIQEGVRLAGVADPESENYDPDFEQYAEYASTEFEHWWDKLWSEQGQGYGDLTYEYINGARTGIRDEIKTNLAAMINNSADAGYLDSLTIYDHMTEDQVSIYDYYYAKDGREAAERYLDSIRESLNYQRAERIYESLEDKTLLELAFGAAAGLEQFRSGVQGVWNAATGNDAYVPQSATQMASGMVREDLADADLKWYNFKDKQWDDAKIFGNSLGQVGYDAVTTTSNMLPSVLASTAIGVINPAVGAAAGSALLGASASGNAYQEMVNLGYDKGQARAYAALVGGSEAGLQYLLGGLGKLGGRLSSNAVSKVLNGVDNAFARTAIKLGGNMLSEGFEEGLQEILTPWFQNLVLNADANVDWGEVAYSSLLGALTAGFMEGHSTISGEVKTYKTGKQLKAAGISAVRLSELGKTFSADTAAYQLAGKVNENTGAYTIGRLFNEIGAELTEANKADIARELKNRCVSAKDAKVMVDAMADVVVGGEFTDKQIAILEANNVLTQAFMDVIVNPNSTVNQRSQGYKEVLSDLAEQQSAKETTANAAQTEPSNQSGKIVTAENTVPAEAENASQSDHEASVEDKTIRKSTGEAVSIKEVASVGNGKMTLRLEDGSEVDYKEIAYSNAGEAYVFETVASLGVDAVEATRIINAFRNSGVAGKAFADGMKLAFEYGYGNFSQQELAQRDFAGNIPRMYINTAYEIGQKMRQQDSQKHESGTGVSVQYSLREFDDGKRYVDVQADSGAFDGMTVAEMNKAAKAILMERFAGKVIGIDNQAFVNGDSVNEYLHPSKSIDLNIRKAKLTAAEELDNLLDAGEALPNEPDGKDGHIHPDAIDFSYYKTVFKVGNEYFEGIVNVKNIKRGKLLKDVTKIRNITKDIVSSYGQNPKSNFLRDASMNSIRNPGETVNKKVSGKAGGVYYTTKDGKVLTIREAEKNGKLALKDKQSVAVKTAKFLQKLGLGGNYYFFESYVDEKGNRVFKDRFGNIQSAPNGLYYSDGDIYIDINAGTDSHSITLRTLSHELTHMIQQWSAAKYKVMADFLAEQYDKEGRNAYEAAKAKQAELSALRGKSVPFQEAYHEFVADSMSTLFDDGSMYDILTDLKKKDKTLADYIKKFFDGLAAKVRKLYANAQAETDEGQFVQGLSKDTIYRLQQMFADALADASENYAASEQKSTDTQIGVQYSFGQLAAQADVTKRYQATVDQILNMQNTKQDHLIIGYTPDVYISLGMPSLPFVIGTGHVYSAAKTEAEAKQDGNFRKGVHYHGLGASVLKNIYEALKNPIMVVASKDVNKNAIPMRSTHSVVAIVDVGSAQNSLLLPVEITAERSVNGTRMDVNALSSVYERDVAPLVKEAIALENTGDVGIYYAKKEALTLPGAGVRFPIRLQQSIASNSIIHSFSEKVNMNISDATQSRQFKRWFGDWQNHPENASKVVNADGTPMVVYHGTNAQFNIFRSQSGEYWFSENEDYAESMMEERGGGEVKAVYLNMRNPYRAKLPPGQFSDPGYEAKILRDARAAHHDGVIIENDTTNPLEAETFYVVFSPEQIKSATDNIGTFDGSNPDIRYQDRTVTPSSRELLAQALESVATDVEDYHAVKEYRRIVPLLDAEEAKLSRLNAQIREMSFGKGKRDSDKLFALRLEAKQTQNRIDIYDKQLLKLEAATPLRRVFEREKAKAYKRAEQKGNEAVRKEKERAQAKYDELAAKNTASRKKAVEGRHKTEMRHKIKSAVKDIDKLLNRGNRDKNVKKGLEETISKTLAVADVLFSPSPSNAEVLSAGVVDMSAAEESAVKAFLDRVEKRDSLTERITELRRGVEISEDYAAEWNKAQPQIQALVDERDSVNGQIAKLRKEVDPVIERARRKIEDPAMVDTALQDLANAYKELENTTVKHLQGAYDDFTYDYILMLKDEIKGTKFQDMSGKQLTQVYDMFKMMQTTIRDANKVFLNGKKQERSALGYSTVDEVSMSRKQAKDSRSDVLEAVRKFGWNALTIDTVLEIINSGTLKKCVADIKDAQGVYFRDMEDAKNFYAKVAKETRYFEWDTKAMEEFASSDGKTFSINLEGKMLLYAYSKRQQALSHLEGKGFSLRGTKSQGKAGTNTVTDSTTYLMMADKIAEVTDTLTKEQKRYVEQLQEYLSKTMGAKGNEVSEYLYGIDLFAEEYYVPLLTDSQFLDPKDADKNKKGTQNFRRKNSGFTKAVTKNAQKAIILGNFTEVWSGHVVEMANYHSMVIPMETFEKVLSFHDDAASVRGAIEHYWGKEAYQYFRDYLDDLNGGIQTDKRGGFTDSLIGLNKMAAVSLSASVVVQQPTAVFRAMEEIDPKYFLIAPKKPNYEQLKQYSNIAGIKQMGGFDARTGRSSGAWLTAQEYDGLKNKVKGFFADKDYRQEAYFWAAGKADETTWCWIWEAVLRETKVKHPSLIVGSKAFMETAGKRFDDVVSRTQVYDSVVSKSGLMRSSNEVTQMATAFMAEPTVSINNLVYGAVKAQHEGWSKGGGAYFARVATAVVTAQIAASLAKAFIQAARDDDDDETYLEKYGQAVLENMVNEVLLMIPNSIPYFRDIVSMAQGWDVERTDMALIGDLVDAINGWDSERKTTEEKIEQTAYALANLFGIPLRNVMRDIKALVNFFNTIIKD